ncbi:MAG: transglutaminase-like domain-containing protein, partial [Acidimicrobiales bacterium]
PNLLGAAPDPAGAGAGASPTGPSSGEAPESAARMPGADSQAVAAGGLRPLVVAFLSCAAAALTTGGIFGSWPARLLGVVAVVVGVAWAGLGVRRPERRMLVQVGMVPLALILSAASLVIGGGNTSGGPLSLMQAAVRAGRLLRPPVPFDPGWRPLLVIIFLLLGFATAWVGAALGRMQLALVIPLPLLLLAAISQPSDQQLLAGILAFVPLVGALAVTFGGDGRSAANLTRSFELRRALRGGALMVPAVAAIVALNQTSFLFPKPTYNPQSKPQKPRAIPLSAITNVDLFDVKGTITGPWKTGDLDTYDGSNWLLPPYLNKDIEALPANGRVGKAPGPTTKVTFTVRDLGTTPVLPGVVGATSISVSGQKLVYDRRDGTFREATGRVPTGLTYTVSLPTYPSPTALENAGPLPRGFDRTYLYVPKPPRAVKALLLQAPANPWQRLSYLLSKESAVEVAVGGGSPVPVPPSTVQRILAGNHQGSPFELVATEALLARWAGVPARIGFGFDGVEQVNGVDTVRPRDAAQWLEVYFPGHGWIPIVTTPPRAKASLNSNKNVKFNPLIQPGTDVAVSIYVPVRIQNLTALYQQVRDVLLGLSPFIGGLVALYLVEPSLLRTLRRRRRRRWAAARSTETAILVEYCELRDAASDLGVGDPYATPIEFLDHLAEDDEHQELAWLVTRSLYGDMAGTTGPEDLEVARSYSRSLRRRLAGAQPVQSRVLAFLSRNSLRDPYNRELPAHPLSRRLHRAGGGPRPVRTRRRRLRLPLLSGSR